VQYYRSCKAGNHPSINQDGFLGSFANSRSKRSRAYQASASTGCDIISISSLSRIPFLCRFFAQEQPFQPCRDVYVTKLFDRHFCGNICPIFIYHIHVYGPTAMLIFNVFLVLILKQHAIFFIGINLLIIYSEIGYNLLILV
jgi:hypothetical protein